MPKETREPQSYGSEKDWVSGRTGQQVNDPKSSPPPEHGEFYDSSHDTDPPMSPDNGGKVSEFQLADNAQPTTSSVSGDSTTPVQKVSTEEGGSKRGSYFRKRDYE
jgi:hypothetical protein